MLRDEFRYYVENQVELSAEYEGKVLVIKDQKVIGVYDSEGEALKKTVVNHDLGSFLIQTCWSSLNFPVKSPYGSPRSVKLLIPPTCLAGEARCEAPRLS